MDIKKIAVIGAGTMGHGIAQIFAQAGYCVNMHSRREESIKKAFQMISDNLQMLFEYGLVKEPTDKIMRRITGTTNINEAAAEVDFVIEAVPELLSVKEEVFRTLDRICPKHTILATNTSGLSITQIASATSRPEKVVGTHFWNPPQLVECVEIIRGLKTSDETVNVVQNLLVKVGKKPVIISKDIPGQVGIRILYAMLREAFSLVEKGVTSIENIDTIVKEALGTRLVAIGLFEMADLAGLDVVANVSEYLFKDLDRATKPPPLLREKIKRGHLGAKSGRGFYEWNERLLASVIKRRTEYLIKLLKNRMAQK